MGSRGRALELTLVHKSKKDRGTLVVKAEPMVQNTDTLFIGLSGSKLDNKDGWFGKSDPFFVLQKSRPDGSYVTVHKSEVVKNDLNPKWKPTKVPLQVICNGDVDRAIRLQVYDWESSGKHELIGECLTSVASLLKPNRSAVELINEKRRQKKGKKYTNSGTVSVSPDSRIEKGYSFLQYIQGGCEISLSVAIDFTASNGDPAHPRSLHHVDYNSRTMNAYETALCCVGNILLEYDSDQSVPLFGFGAKFPNHAQANHCFALNFNERNPEVSHVSGMLEAYRNAITQIRLSGPTLFTHIIEKACSLCDPETSQQTQKYNVFLILTDGVINDMDATIDAVVKASRLPLSIIVVGIGNADFGPMETLDGDEHVLKDSYGNPVLRDIIQFVPFNKFHGNGTLLSKEVLAEVPAQLVEYMKLKKISPPEPLTEKLGNVQINSSQHASAPPLPPTKGVHL